MVEDDASISEMYRLRLELDDCHVEVARDGEEGLTKALGATYDLILLDMQLPKLNGLAVLGQLRARGANRHTPVVVLSNLETPEFQEAARRLGALDYLIKSRTTPAAMSRMVDGWTPVEELEGIVDGCI